MTQASGAPIYVGAGEAAAAQAAAPSAKIIPVSDGDHIAVGGLSIACLATPGHTIAGTSYLVDGNVMTGDTLFVGGCGRTDFPGGDPRILWRSLQKLASLPEETKVYPGHDYGQTPTSTIGWERTSNPYLLCQSEDEFVALRTGKNPPRPIRRTH
jgi:glyoxylase-like metal-dependent hydrolase (beta-lactamase superfamily II)